MSKMPARIWADVDGEWHSHDFSEVRDCAIYIRADIVEKLVAALEKAEKCEALFLTDDDVGAMLAHGDAIKLRDEALALYRKEISHAG